MRCLGGCLFLHRVVVSSFFSSSSNNSTRSLDVIVVGRSKKPRKRVERLSPHLYKERDDSCLCAFGQNTTNKSFPPKNKKKHPLSFITSRAFFFVPISPFCAVSPKKQKENRKISSFWKRERRKNVVKTKRAQTKHTQEERKKNSRE